MTTPELVSTDPVVPAAGTHRPAAVNVRLVCSPKVMDAALTALADLLGDAWQSGTRKPSRHEGGDVLVYGTLIVPVPTGDTR
jgi:hypothetical protein